MAMKFYNVEKAAELLGITPAEVNAMREQQKLHGYRDGADWKFKAEEIEALAAQKPAAAGEEGDDEDVLLTEVELGQVNPSASGTILGPPPADALGSSLSGFEDLDLSLADSGLDMSGLDLSSVSSLTGKSELDMSTAGMDDDDLVLGAGGSGAGSDLTVGGDSGISLLDPSDSGLSLEEPLDLAGASHDSLALSDEMLVPAKKGGSEAPTELGSDSDFKLTPMDEVMEGEEDSSSQVIALDEGEDSDELMGVTPMLDGDVGDSFSAAPLDLGGGAMGDALALELPAATVTPAATVDFSAAHAQAAGGAAGVMPEAPYTTLNIVGLAFCTIVLFVVGMMMYDLVRNMWSWNQPTPVNSWLMDLIWRR
ncbi:MAG TPA: helix-turn-helix domain-containing protein [Thermoguttaceae bacterium]|nr:helix-turn-helix domain-containing protein [Thermoguttaceae bacterium]